MSDEAKKDVDLTAITADLVAKYLKVSGGELLPMEFIQLIADTRKALESGSGGAIALTADLVTKYLEISGRDLSRASFITLIVDTMNSLESGSVRKPPSRPHKSAASRDDNDQIHAPIPQHPLVEYADPGNEEIVQHSSKTRPAKGFAIGLLRESGKKYHPQRNVFTEGPAVDIATSASRDRVICLECGAKLHFLKRHLRTYYGMTFDEYKQKWGLDYDYPQAAEGYRDRRRKYAEERKAEMDKQDTPRRAGDKNS